MELFSVEILSCGSPPYPMNQPSLYQWAIQRIEAVELRSDEEWFWRDRKDEERRIRTRSQTKNNGKQSEKID